MSEYSLIAGSVWNAQGMKNWRTTQSKMAILFGKGPVNDAQTELIYALEL